MQLFHAILTALADAFMQVGVFVAVLVGAFGWLRWRHGERIIGVLERHRLWGPAIGAVLGVSPGCAGAIMVMPLFARRSVSYGTVIAALVATMGDSSWVIMAVNPEMAGVVHGILFVTGLVTGYAVDLLRVRPAVPDPAGGTAVERPPEPGRPSASVSSRRSSVPVLARIDTGIDAGIRMEPRGTLGLAMRAPVDLTPVVFWMLVLTGFMVAFPTASQMVDPAFLISLAGGIDPYLTLGLAGPHPQQCCSPSAGASSPTTRPRRWWARGRTSRSARCSATARTRWPSSWSGWPSPTSPGSACTS